MAYRHRLDLQGLLGQLRHVELADVLESRVKGLLHVCCQLQAERQRGKRGDKRGQALSQTCFAHNLLISSPATSVALMHTLHYWIDEAHGIEYK